MYQEEPTAQMLRGLMLHDAFHQFFLIVKPAEILNITATDSIRGEQLYAHFVRILDGLLHREDPLFNIPEEVAFVERSIAAFATMEVNRIYLLRSILGKLEHSDLVKFWMPKYTERMMVSNKHKLYGTIDRAQVDPDGRHYLFDYKLGTGKDKKGEANEQEKEQALIYIILYAEAEGLDPINVEMNFVYLNAEIHKMPNMVTVKWTARKQKGLLETRLPKYRAIIEGGDFPCTVDVCKPEQRIFKLQKVCAHCAYTELCFQVPRTEFAQWLRQQEVR